MSVVRDLGFIRWADNYGPLEEAGPLLTEAIHEIDNRIETYIKNSVDNETMNVWRALFKARPKFYPPYYSYRWNRLTIYVCEHNRYLPNYTITIKNGHTLNLQGVVSFGTTKTLLWSVTDISNGEERLALRLYDTKLANVTTIHDVGDSVAARGESIYYLGAEQILWFNSLRRIHNSHTYLVYKEANPKYSLILQQPKYQSDIFLLRKSALYQDLALVTADDTLVWLAKGYGRKIPITRNIIAYDTHLTIGGRHVDYPPQHFILEGYRKTDTVFCTFSTGAKQAIYKYNLGTDQWTPLIEPFVGEIAIAKGVPAFIFGYPNQPDMVITETNTSIFKGAGSRYALESGTAPVPWFIVHPAGQPRGVVICGYGSYGTHTKKYQAPLWQPWLARGYAVATLCVRGGGELGDAWWSGGITPQNLHNRVDDFVAGVLFLQNRYKFDETNTIIYGRSAGGFLVTASAYRLMDKIGAIYAAKPYTDLLRTTCNATAGQTLQEADEFGYVEHDPLGFKANFEISPYETAPTKPAVNPGVLVTAGINDSEVPHFQPIRYIKRLQDLGWHNVFCRVAKNEGHFTQVGGFDEALDAAVLESFLRDKIAKKPF